MIIKVVSNNDNNNNVNNNNNNTVNSFKESLTFKELFRQFFCFCSHDVFFCEESFLTAVHITPGEGWRMYQLKCCINNKNKEFNHPNYSLNKEINSNNWGSCCA